MKLINKEEKKKKTMHHVENVCMGIPEWYSGQKIFITGSTGFMGKVLVEKLLRDCKDVDTFYLLVRSKRGVEPAQRRDIYLNSPVSKLIV